jgi:hypothetical protein
VILPSLVFLALTNTFSGIVARPSDSADFDDIFEDFDDEDELVFGADDEGEDQDELDHQDDQDEEEQDGVEYLADPEATGCEPGTLFTTLHSIRNLRMGPIS